MTIGTKIYTWLNGQFVGEDEFGNRYFHERVIPKSRRRSRWVMYKGKAEASKVPPQWHRWLHYAADKPPQSNKRTYEWESAHLPNLTGTVHAYMPEGHARKGGKRYRVSADYQPWQPK